MREMKNSGVEWIGEIPVEWSFVKFKYVYASTNSGEVIDKGYWDNGEEYLYTCKKTQMLSDYPNFPNHKRTTGEDLLLTRNATPYVFLPIKNAIYTNVVQRVVLKEGWDRKFIKYALQCGAENYQTYGISIPSYNLDVWNGILIANIPSVLQKKIVVSIEKELGKISTLISNVKNQIEKLNAYKKSLITEVVTKGLDPAVPLRDSGVDWIGEIPVEWDVIKLKYITHISRGLFNHRPRNDPQFYDGEYPFIQTGDVARAKKYITTYSQTLNERGISVSKQFPKGTMTMTIAANVGDVAILGFDAYFPDSVVGFTVKAGFDENYVYYLFQALKESFIRASIVSTQLNLNIERSKEIVVSVTYDEQEQKKIAVYLEEKCDQIDHLITIKQAKIEKLEQYKKSLIYEYVTGKKEVL